MRGLGIGQRHFARFTLTRPLGRGGMGVVWLAHDESLSEAVALKFLPNAVRWDPAALAELKAETRHARQLSHPHIVRIHDFVEDAQSAAIAMEFIAGRTLTEERLSRPGQVLEPAEIAPWLDQLGSALDYAHRTVRLVHRDLKPSNLMLTSDGRIKVTDFGVARSMGESILRVSQVATTGGTLLYMSPQQAFGEPPTPRDDIYALGATLYELLTGKPPFYTGNVAAQLERRRPDSITERRRQFGVTSTSSIPKAWEETIAACLAKQPEDRPASAGEVTARLQTSSPKASGRQIRARPQSPSWRRPLLLATLACALALTAWNERADRVAAADAPAPSFAAHASDASRAYAAWNLDGDGRESSGRDWDLFLSNVVPVEDRFGRIDAALGLNGTSVIQRELPEATGWSAREPFSFALWARPSNGISGRGGVLFALRNDVQGDLYWSLDVAGGRVGFHLGELEVDSPDGVASSVGLPAARWSHVAVVSDGQEMRLFVDGRQVARREISPRRRSRFTAPPNLAVGAFHRFDLERFAGAVDDLRLWRRPLRASEIARLAAREPAPRFMLTRGTYAASADLSDVVMREFGADATVADWQEIKRWHADDTVAWCDALPFARMAPGPLLQNAGQRFSKSTRHYFLTRFEGRRPDYYLAHEELGGMRLALGSWQGVTGPVLARRPFAPPRRETIKSDDGPDVVHEMASARSGSAPHSLALEWNQEMKSDGGFAAHAEIGFKDGRKLLAVCAPSTTGAFALALGASERPEVSRQVGGTSGTLRFTVVLRSGKLLFRAVNVIGAGIIFQEEVAIDFTAREIARLTVRGVDAAFLTVQE